MSYVVQIRIMQPAHVQEPGLKHTIRHIANGVMLTIRAPLQSSRIALGQILWMSSCRGTCPVLNAPATVGVA